MTQDISPFNPKLVKVLLLEGLNATGVSILQREGFDVVCHAKALPEDLLIQEIADVDVIGIRSKTQLKANVLQHAKKLKVIGCFCIGTNQVDLTYAAEHGIAVFNSPFSNSRSVAEMVIAQVIALARHISDRNIELHAGKWIKSHRETYHEIRGKTLGIVGYGHIGSQLSVLADAMGMKVIFYDVLQTMPLGTAKPCATLHELLSTADFVTLHVPDTPETRLMIGKKEIESLKTGAFLINASRGTVVDIPSLVDGLKSGKLAGAAVDVFPEEPFKNGPFESPLQGCKNVFLSPHIGGSTEEAQSAIGTEVASALVKFITTGATLASVNFPEIELRAPPSRTIRVLNTHQNVPGVLRQINRALSEWNIEKQICDSKDTIAYFIADVTIETEQDISKIYEAMSSITEGICTRLLY